jgi:hypothetical protein
MKSLIRAVLTLAFGWSALKGLELLLRSNSMDLLLLNGVGMGWLFYLLIPALAVCQVISLIWFWHPFLRGHFVAIAAILLSLIHTLVVCLIAVGNTELAKQSFTASREERGLPVRQEMLQLMSNPIAQLIPLAIAGALALLWFVLIMKLKNLQHESLLAH